ncbi:MAG: hypothetical protein L3J16_04520, partial [Anaerolineales bacterium]|nr:hypothetical protein [Anaerolineales bacterium]
MEGDDKWSALDRFFLSDAVDEYLQTAPTVVSDCYPSFLDAFKDGNIVQVWSGYALKTDDSHCHLVRAPINLPLSGSFQHFEGLIDSSWHVGPLLINIRLIKQDIPIHFPKHRPLMQLVP